MCAPHQPDSARSAVAARNDSRFGPQCICGSQDRNARSVRPTARQPRRLETAAKSGKGGNDVALINSYVGVIERTSGDTRSAAVRIRVSTGLRERDHDRPGKRLQLLAHDRTPHIFDNMQHKIKSISQDELSKLEALVRGRGSKRNASVSLSGSLLDATDRIAGAAQRSAFIERALRRHLRRILRRQRDARELAILNAKAERLNAESDAVLADQAPSATNDRQADSRRDLSHRGSVGR